MTDVERKDAMEWLERCARHWRLPDDAKPIATLQAMLAEPRLPAEPDAEMRRIYSHGGVVEPEETHRALYAHLTKPATVEPPAPEAPPVHVDIGHTNTSPQQVVEACVEALVRMGKMTVGGSIGDRINARINPPRATKEVEVWHVHFAGAAMRLPFVEIGRSREEADQQADRRQREGAACVYVTGPHRQTVPA